MNILEIQDRTPTLINQLLEVWEDSVTHTHLFLLKEEISDIKKYAKEGLEKVRHLIIIENNNILIAFMGIEKNKLEMLFVKYNEIGKSIGKQLLNYGIKNYDIKELTVNEESPNAVNFYKHLGFKTYKRENKDEQENQYPILYMKSEK